MMTHAAQKAALTRAVKSGDAEKILQSCRDAVAEWDRTGWPDDWTTWQRALTDAGVFASIDDLVAA